MSGITTAPASTSAQISGAPPLDVLSTYLTPGDPFPSTLAELALVELLVLHSRITRQLEREYIDPAGPHPVTLDRVQELADELDTRQDFLAPAEPATPVAPEAQAPRLAQRKAAGPRPEPVAERHAAAPGQSTPAAPRQVEKRPSASLSAQEEERSETGVPIYDLNRLRPGEPVQVWCRGQLQCVGTVEEAAPALGVVWIREGLDGYRRMIHPHDDTELRSAGPHHRGDDR
jgi:hypothetical protein